MNRLHIINPAAGKRNPFDLIKEKLKGEEYYITQGVGDAERFVREHCTGQPETHFIVYGGDGTLCEVVNGILSAGAGGEAVLSVVPTGTGNDFHRLLRRGERRRFDALKYRIGESIKYAVNIINTGFDTTVVEKMQNYKRLPLVTGSMAYIFGVGDTLLHKMGERWKLKITEPDGSETEEEDEYLLALAANGRYYGGGFMAAPVAETDDGLLDILLAKKVSRMRFLSLVAEYRKGKHIDPESKKPVKKFEGLLDYRRCVKISIEGLRSVCVDGEVMPAESIEVGVVPDAVTVQS
ncbi:MAG TPA: diacylglycerol kinase family protein [Bacillota bacterium]|nr:diacylglycerol kinase family protein [Bacillota bacterium]